MPGHRPQSPEQLAEELEAARRRISELESEQRESSRRDSALLDAFFRASPAGLAIWDHELRYVKVNETLARINGVAVEEHLGRSPADVLPKLAPVIMPLLERALREPVLSVEVSGEVPAEPGVERHWVVSYFPVAGPDRRVAAGGVIVDITDLKTAEEECRRLESQFQQTQKLESLGVLAGGIAHDFNNLLTGLLGSVELALRDVQPHAPIRPLLHNIQVAGKHAADLTGQMLAYSGKGGFVVEEVDINSMIRDMSSLLASSTSKKVRLSYELSEDLPGVKADATQLRQVVLNLVGNASDAASGQTGEVHVATGVTNCDRTLLDGLSPNRAIPSGRYVTLRVRDMGCGMDPDTRAKVFDPFFTTKSTGRGLGLAAVHGIVTGHEGAIEVESEPGQGTSFKVLLPALDRPAVGLVATAEPSVTWRGSGIVLVVDDEAMVRKVAAHMLKRVGFSSVLASDGVEAVERFRECSKEITAVLLDLNMPRMDGEETLAELRKIEGSVPVVLCSGYDERESTGRFGGRGLAGFLEKPYDLAALREALRKALDSPTVIA